MAVNGSKWQKKVDISAAFSKTKENSNTAETTPGGGLAGGGRPSGPNSKAVSIHPRTTENTKAGMQIFEKRLFSPPH